MIELTLNQKFALAYAAGIGHLNEEDELYSIITEGDNCEFEYIVGHKTDIVPARTTGKPEDCYPAEGGELEYDMYFLNSFVDIEELPETVFNELDRQISAEVFN